MGNVRDFSDLQSKGSKISGKIQSILTEKIRAPKKSFAPTSFCRRATVILRKDISHEFPSGGSRATRGDIAMIVSPIAVIVSPLSQCCRGGWSRGLRVSRCTTLSKPL